MFLDSLAVLTWSSLLTTLLDLPTAYSVVWFTFIFVLFSLLVVNSVRDHFLSFF